MERLEGFFTLIEERQSATALRFRLELDLVRDAFGKAAHAQLRLADEHSPLPNSSVGNQRIDLFTEPVRKPPIHPLISNG